MFKKGESFRINENYKFRSACYVHKVWENSVYYNEKYFRCQGKGEMYFQLKL